ncbi:hypothetical protein BCT47_25465 [Vibrio splendidus]|uniref:restriction endonuclease subunit S n=1 Tax=Vibrio splendidus TaxID=29497 RepID=UPI000C81ABDF|nr:restriction endonuclease subunit S [Vibrio splendidus]PMM72114.1 hypothetical protein BCT47_25465 [Vibrio splendidus]
MSFEIKKATLGDFLNFKNGKKSPERADNASFPVFGSNGLIGRAESTNCPENTIVIGRVGSYCGSVHFSKEKCWVSDNAISCSSKNAGEEHFWFYVLTKLNLNQFSSGSGQPLLNQATLNAVECEVPNNSSIRALIGNVLNDYDKKIKLNAVINQTLEEMAQAIFKSWFVDFDPVKAKMNGEQPEGMDEATASLFPEKLVESELGLIPEGWEVGTLSDVAKYCSARTNTDTITLENYISTENMLAEKKGVTAASKLPTAKTVAAYKSGDILVSNIRPYFKKIWLAEGSGGRSNDVLGFESVSANSDSYLMNLLYQDTFFEYMTRTSKGAKMPRGDKTAIMNWEMAVPPVELRETFSAIVDKFYQLIPQNRAQNATLVSLRDTLLPKLLSGEIELDKVLDV